MFGTHRLAAAALCTALAISGTAQAGAWQATGSLSQPRFYHSQTTLQDGTVIVVGGDYQADFAQRSVGALSSVERYDPSTGNWTPTGPLNTPRIFPTTALLNDGTVLAVGGEGPDEYAQASAEIYSPALGTWSWTASMAQGRINHAMTLLPDGTVLVAGGQNDSFQPLTSAERYVPANGATPGYWTDAGTSPIALSFPSSALLASGLVLTCDQDGAQNCALYDPNAAPELAWSLTGGLNGGFGAYEVMSALPNGQAIAFGSGQSNVELYDAASGSWSVVNPWQGASQPFGGQVLDDGYVFAAGGAGASPMPVLLYRPALGNWRQTDPMSYGRYFGTSSTLLDGRVLVAGGADFNNNDYPAPAEIFTPPPAISPAAPTTHSGGTVAFAGVGGTPGYTWSFADGGNVSGGTIDSATGVYVAGSADGVQDTIQITDALGFTETAQIAVSPVTITLTANADSPDCDNIAGIPSALIGATGLESSFPTCGVSSGQVITLTVQVTADDNPVAWWSESGVSTFNPVMTSSTTYTVTADEFQVNEFNELFVWPSDFSISDATNQAALFIWVQPDALLPVAVTPNLITVDPGTPVSFVASQGNPNGVAATGYIWTFLPSGNNSNGTVDQNGNYVAGSTGGVVDSIQVSDQFGSSAIANIFVNAAAAPVVTLTANSTTPSASCTNVTSQNNTGYCEIAADQDVAFTVDVQNSSDPIVWVLSNETSFDTVTPIQNGSTYSLPPGSLSVGFPNTLYAQLASDPSIYGSMLIWIDPPAVPIFISPSSASTYAGDGISFIASGGDPSSSGFTFSFTPGGNNSGASLDPQIGTYYAGTVGGTTDTIQVSDSLGNTATATVAVQSGVSPYFISLTTNATTPATGCLNVVTDSNHSGFHECELAAGQDVTFAVDLQNDDADLIWYLSNAQAFTAVVPIRNGNTYSLPAGSLSIGYPNGIYVGPINDVQLSANILIWIDPAPLVLSPTSATVQPGASLGLTVSGGVAPYNWSLITSPSGGTFVILGDTSAITYTAGLGIGVQDVIQVTDSQGTAMSATITIPGATQVVGCNSQTVVYSPALSTSGLLMFEDNWPASGDLDFNDQTIAYNDELVLDGSQNVTQMKVNLSVLAIGASIHNGVSLHLPLPASTAVTALLTIGSDSTSITPFTGAGDPDLVFNLVSDTRSLFAQQDTFINTDVTIGTQTGTPITLTLTFGTAVALDPSLAPYDLFIAQTANPAHEIHLPQYPGTASMDTTLFDTIDDASSTTGGLHFINGDGLPFALALPDVIAWPQERVSIDQVYSDIVEFGSSGGAFNQDWYANGADGPLAFTAGPAPTATIDLLTCE